MKKIISLFAACLLCAGIFSQSTGIIVEQWNSNPVIHSLDSKYKNESAVIILDKRRIEYADEGKNGLMAYRTLHKIVRVNDDKGIESFNKVYLGVTDNADIIDIKARTILPGGKIIEIDKSNIKDLKDEDGSMYKIFALEGLEKGCDIEYYYTYKRDAGFFGREILQGPSPVMKAQIEIVTPERLVFETKPFNAVFSTTDTVTNGKRIVTVQQQQIAGAEDEKYSTYTANLQRVEYKLAYNLSRSRNERLFTWSELAKRMYDVYTSYTEKELKRVEELVGKNHWASLPNEREKIVAVENFLKKNFTTREDIDADNADNIEKIIKSKIASYTGIIRLYGAIYQTLGISYQFVLAGDRNEFTVDKAFENWNNPQNPLIYFINQKKFIAPTRADMRYPWIAPFWGGTNGLFCKATTIGSFTTAIAEVKPIPLEDYTQSANNIVATIKVDVSSDSLLIDIKQIYTGYSASVYRASFNFSSAEDQRLFIKELVKFGTNSENIISSKTENQDFESYSDNKPFILHASVKANELLEKAGNKLLVKIGDIIGPQVEMYQEKPRQFPMEIPYPHLLERKIEFIIPEGYVVKNLNDLNINDVYKDNGNITMGFVSSYKQEGNIIKIHVVEEYRNTFYPLTQYDDFKKIINAAADFNKIVLVLEKK